MEAKAKSITFLADEGSVQIPFFQRGYVWTKVNWDDMLTDLLEFNKSHFLGSLILKQLKAITGEPKSVLVIDGQQRLTSLSILLKALYDSFDEEMRRDTSAELIKYLFYKKYATDRKYHIKITHSRVDASYFKQTIGEVQDGIIHSPYFPSIDTIGDKSNKILQCYKYFYTELSKKDDDTRTSLFNHLLNSENKIIVLIDLTEHDNEQAIFDTINSAGIRLSGTDIVKNALFQRAMELLPKEDVISLYEECWEKTFSLDDDSLIFWGTQKSTGRLMRDHSEILLQTIAIIKGLYDPEKHTLSELPDLYKDKIADYSEQELRGLINEIKEYANIYRGNMPSFDGCTLYSYDDFVQRLFHILDACDISTFHPYIIFLLKKYKDNEATLKTRLNELESLIVSRLLAKQETKSYNKLCKDFIGNEDQVKTKADAVTRAQIQSGIKFILNKNASIVLFWIELYRRSKDTKQSIKELKYNYSLEHLMPQKWEEHWSSIPVVDDSGNTISDLESAKKFRNEKIYSIGNMTLLNSRLNTSLRNFIFSRKIEGEGRKKGIRQYSELWITKADIINRYDSGETQWDEKSITYRENALCNELFEIWKL